MSADEGIQVPYNRDLKSLEAVLSAVRRPGDFFVQVPFETAMPRVEIEGVGVLSFPVPEAQVRQIIQQASRAPFGRGEQTIYDESVRKVWQLPPEKVRLGGKSWGRTFTQILAAVTDGLGCAEANVSAELYKLLVYDEGGFFQAHRDTEKAPGMFGTMIVVLPSAHRGGELIVRHADREVVLDLSSTEVSELQVAAFYADCEHEVRPVTEGYRVCLVYNLVQPRAGKSGAGRTLTAPVYQTEMETAANRLREAFAGKGAPAKLAWLFQHAYSPAGLSFAGLKGEDAALAKVLRQAAERADCAVHLGIVHIEETGPAEPDYNDRSGRWGYDDYGEGGDDDDVDSDNYEVVEVSESWCHIGEWHDTEDRPVGFGDLPLQEGEVLPAGALDDAEPDAQRLTEATGNAGVSFERSYHRAALVLWPRDRFADVLFQAGVGAVLPHLAERVDDPAADRRSVMALARRVVKDWEESAVHYSSDADPKKNPSRPEMIRLLLRLGNPGLVERFVGGVVTSRFDGSENEALIAAAVVLGPMVSAERLGALAKEKTGGLPRAVVGLLGGLVRELGGGLSEPWKKALTEVAAVIVAALPELKPPAKKPAASWTSNYASSWGSKWTESRMQPEGKPGDDERPLAPGAVDAAMVTELLGSLSALDANSLRAEATVAIAANTAAFDPVTVVVPALTASRTELANDAELARLWRHAAKFLLARSEHPPAPPTDWKLKAKIACPCEDCRALQTFTQDPVVREHRFRVKKERRQHLHQTIERLGLDMTHETERKGSPQTLVCVKTRRTYERQREQHRADIAAMRALLDGPPGASNEATGLADRMIAAKERKSLPA